MGGSMGLAGDPGGGCVLKAVCSQTAVAQGLTCLSLGLPASQLPCDLHLTSPCLCLPVRCAAVATRLLNATRPPHGPRLAHVFHVQLPICNDLQSCPAIALHRAFACHCRSLGREARTIIGDRTLSKFCSNEC